METKKYLHDTNFVEQVGADVEIIEGDKYIDCVDFEGVTHKYSLSVLKEVTDRDYYYQKALYHSAIIREQCAEVLKCYRFSHGSNK